MAPGGRGEHRIQTGEQRRTCRAQRRAAGGMSPLCWPIPMNLRGQPLECAGRAQRRRRFGLTARKSFPFGASQCLAKAESRCACLRTPNAALERSGMLSLALVSFAGKSPTPIQRTRRDRKVTVASFVRHEAILTSPITRTLSYDYETNQRINQDAPASSHTSL